MKRKVLTIKEMREQDYITEIYNNIDDVVTSKTIKKLFELDIFRIFGFCYLDLRDKDFSRVKLEDMQKIPYNSSTLFPDKTKLPIGFVPLDLKKLAGKYKKFDMTSFTDKCSFAVIDNPVGTPEHELFKDKDIEFVSFEEKDDNPHFHLMGVLSNLYLNFNFNNTHIIAYSHSWEKRAKDDLKALVDIEKRIKGGEKIFAVSVSSSLLDERYQKEINKEIKKQIEKLKALDCIVFDSPFCDRFRVLPCSINQNSKCIELGFNAVKKGELTQIIKHFKLVLTSPVYADIADPKGYVLELKPGQSWIIPQIVFLYSQLKTQYNKLTIEEFAELLNTSCEVKNQFNVLSIKKLVANFKKFKKFKVEEKETI